MRGSDCRRRRSSEDKELKPESSQVCSFLSAGRDTRARADSVSRDNGSDGAAPRRAGWKRAET